MNQNINENQKPKGRILAVKQGYNPNSSSMGSIVFALPVALFAVTAAFGVAAGTLLPLVMKKGGQKALAEPESAKQPGEGQ